MQTSKQVAHKHARNNNKNKHTNKQNKSGEKELRITTLRKSLF